MCEPGGSADQFGDRAPVVDDRRGAAVEGVDEDLGRVDAQVLVDRREEVARRADALDRVFSLFVGRTDDAAGLDAAAGPDVGEGPRPVVAAGLFGARRCAGVAGAGAGLVIDLGGTTELAG